MENIPSSDARIKRFVNLHHVKNTQKKKIFVQNCSSPSFFIRVKKISMKNLRKVERTFVIDLHEYDLFACNRVCTPRLQGNREREIYITSNSKNSNFWLHRKLQSGTAQSRYRFTLSSEMFARLAKPAVTEMSIIFGRVINQLARATSITGAH